MNTNKNTINTQEDTQNLSIQYKCLIHLLSKKKNVVWRTPHFKYVATIFVSIIDACMFPGCLYADRSGERQSHCNEDPTRHVNLSNFMILIRYIYYN